MSMGGSEWAVLNARALTSVKLVNAVDVRAFVRSVHFIAFPALSLPACVSLLYTASTI